MLHILEHTFFDSLKILPFLFITFIIIELLEHKYNGKVMNSIKESGKFGPIIGSFLGIIPQCGFSVVATNLYITRVISIGTLFSIYLSTSDEMLPILIGKDIDLSIIFMILGIKFVTGIIFGIMIDYFFVNNKNITHFNYNVCEEDGCDCEHGILKSSLKHTLKIFIFLLITSFIVNLLFEYTNDNFISKIFMKNSIFGTFIGSLIGLIPNCGASVVLTELFIKGAISIGSLISGLLTGSGVAILILFKSNKNLKENIYILIMLYLIGVFVGMLVEFVNYFL